ncbi:10633_t:CDS:2, partial [Gigaspora margarita]
QQIPEISSGLVSIQQIFHPNISQPYPLLPISTTNNIPPFFDQLSTKSNSTRSFSPLFTSPPNIPSRYPSPSQIISHCTRGNDGLFLLQFSDNVTNHLTQSLLILPNQSAICFMNIQQNIMVSSSPMMMNNHNYYHPYHQIVDHSYAYPLEKTSKDITIKAKMLENK